MYNLHRWLSLLLLLTMIFSIQADSKELSLPLEPCLQEFVQATSFKGKITPCNDARVFAKLEGIFSYPSPHDAAAICRNADDIADALNAMYRQQNATFALRRTYYDAVAGCVTYQQYWGNFYAENQSYYLLIIYHKATDSYTIVNNLYMKPVIIPETIIDAKSAFAIYEVIVDNPLHLKEWSEIPIRRIPVASASYGFSLWGDSEDMRLNIFPASGDSSQAEPELALSWKSLRFVGNGTPALLIEAGTGTPRGKCAERWQQRQIRQVLIDDFIRQTGFQGEYCSSGTDDGIMRFGEVRFTMPEPVDLASFETNADRIITPFAAMLEAVGRHLNLIKGQSEMINRSDYGDCYKISYLQQNPVTNNSDRSNQGNSLTLYYSKSQHTYSLDNRLHFPKLVVPPRIIDPETALSCALVESGWISVARPDAKTEKISLKMTDPYSVPRDQQYTDPKTKLTVSLHYIDLGQGEEGEYPGTLHLVWRVFWQKSKDDLYYLDAVTGKPYFQGSQTTDTSPKRENRTAANELKARKQLPDYILTPETAWHIVIKESILPWSWTERKTYNEKVDYSGTVEEISQNIYKQQPKSDYEDALNLQDVKREDISIKLILQPMKEDENLQEYDDYVLIYQITLREDDMYGINAVTGKEEFHSYVVY